MTVKPAPQFDSVGDVADSGPSARRALAVATAVFGATLLLLVLSSLQQPMTWDEGNHINRALRITEWFELLRRDPRAACQADAINEGWPFTTQVEGHPAFFATLIAGGLVGMPDWVPPLLAARTGALSFFALAVAALSYRLARDQSVTAAVVAVLVIWSLPRLWAHALYASFDGPLTAGWVLAWVLFPAARRHPAGVAAWGIAVGMTLSCKATGWIAPVPFVIWTALYRDRSGLRALLWGIPIALVTFYVLNPPLWHAPVAGIREFFALNGRREFNIPTQFFGRTYDLDRPLPWYNAFLLTAITIPVGSLLLVGAGAVRAVARFRIEPLGILLVGQWLVLPVVRAFPFAPPHDGIRLFVPSFAFAAALAGYAVHGCVKAVRTRSTAVRWLNGFTLTLLLSGSMSSMFWYAPHWLSYYNLLIGGLPGATRAGMEPTYYWDSLDGEVLRWLDERTGPAETVHFQNYPLENLSVLEAWGLLPVAYTLDSERPGSYRWYVMQHRPSMYTNVDRALVREARAAEVLTIRSGWGPWDLDVPLLSIFAREEVERITTEE